MTRQRSHWAFRTGVGRGLALAAVVLTHQAGPPAIAADSPIPRIAGATPVTRGTPVDGMAPMHRHAYLHAIRRALAGYGYRPGAESEPAAMSLGHAIRAYQHDVGLPVDGVATRELLDHLLFVRPAMAARPRRVAVAPPSVPETADRGVASEIPSVTAAPPMPKLPLGVVTGTDLAPPREAPEPAETDGVVTRVQRKLRSRGLYRGPVDGVFAPALAAAIARYQADAGLPVTKIIDAPLLNALSAEPKTARSDRAAGGR